MSKPRSRSHTVKVDGKYVSTLVYEDDVDWVKQIHLKKLEICLVELLIVLK